MKSLICHISMFLVLLSSSIYTQELSVSTTQKYDVRGIPEQSEGSLNGKEIVSDYDGNVMLNYSQTSELFNGQMTDLSFYYNINVEHKIFLQGPFSDKPGISVNSPEWIISFAGFAIQTLNFETEFFTTRGPLGIGGTMENSQVAMLIPGYHYSNQLSYDLSNEYNGAFLEHDVIQILMGDGSKKILVNSVIGQRTGLYFEEGVDGKGAANVTFLSGSNLLRKMYYHPGDGNTYYFEEEFSKLNGKDEVTLTDPKVLYLKEIYSQFGDTLQLDYLNYFPPDIDYGITNGRKIFNSVTINKKFETLNSGSYHTFINLNYNMLDFLDTEKLYSISTTNYYSNNNFVFTMDVNDQTDLISAGNRDAQKRKIVKILQVKDQLNRCDNINYSLSQREYSLASYQSLVKINSPLISQVAYSNGKKTEFSFYDKSFSGQPVGPIEIFTDIECIPENVQATFRDCYTNFILKERKFFEDNIITSNEIYNYSYSPADNNNLPYHQLLRALVVKSIKTEKRIKNFRIGDTSIPEQDIINTQLYNRYKTGWGSYVSGDFACATRLVEDKTEIQYTNPNSTNFVKKIYNYEIGDSTGIYSYARTTGSIKRLSSREITFDGVTTKERLLDSLRILEWENLSNGNVYGRQIPKKEEIRDGSDLLTTIEYKNFIPTSYTSSSFYKLDLIDQIKKAKGDTIKSNDKYYYYGEENIPGESPDGVMKGLLKQKINNYYSRSRSEDYRYFIPTESSRYRGYLKSIAYSNGTKIIYSYPDKINQQDPAKPYACDSVYANKIDYNGLKSSNLFVTRGQQLKPFKTSIIYNNLQDTLNTYTSYDPKNRLNFEVDANKNYSEYEYDVIGRIKNATFAGGFSNYDTVLTHTYSIVVKDTLIYSYEKGSYRTVKTNGETYTGLDIIKTPEQQSTDGGIEWAIETDSEQGGESDGPVDTTKTKVPRNCYMFFEQPLITTGIDSLISVELMLVTSYCYLPDSSESRTVFVRGIKSDSTAFGNQVSFTFSHPITYQENDINLRPIIEQFKAYGYTLIGLQFDSPSLSGTYEYNFKEFKIAFTGENHPLLSITYSKTIIDYLNPEGSLFAYYNDNNRTVNSIRRFSNSPDKLSNILESTQYYDVEGNLVKSFQKNDSGNFIQKQKVDYNFLQAPNKIEDGEFRATFTKYDYLARPVQSKLDENWTIGPSKKIDYYLSSESEYYNIEQLTDENNLVSRKYFDKIGNLKKEEKINGDSLLTTSYNYDNLYRLTSITSPAGKITSYQYDDHSNISQKTSPDEGTTKYKYDKYDNLRFSINNGNSGALTFNKYDNFNRLILTGEYTFTNSFDLLNPDLDYSTNQGSIWAFENYTSNQGNFVLVNMYDKYLRTGVFANLPQAFADSLINLKGKLVATAFRDKTSNSWSYKLYSYDHLGRVRDEYVFFQSIRAYKKIANEYDNLGNLTKQNVNNQFYTWYSYDEQARLKEVRSNKNNAFTTAKLDAVYDYDKSDKVLSAKYGTYGNWAPKVLYTYDGKGRVSDINGFALDVFTKVFQQTLTYYNNDNIHTMFLRNDGNGSWPNLNFTYSYDNYNRLTSAACSNSYYTENYAYDYDGNLTHKTRPYNTSQSLTYDYSQPPDQPLKNQLTRLTKGGTNYSFTYDYKGNMLTDTKKLITGMTYDRRNLPVSVNKSSVYYLYNYDDAGQRIYKQTSSTTKEYYLRDHTGKELAVYDWYTGKLKMLNLYGNGLIGKVNVSYNIQNARTDSRQYYIKDYLGSIRMTIDEKTFEVISAQDYFPFGGIMENRSYTTGGNLNDKYKFTEKERDTETNYDYFGARYYDSELGIWRSVDPAVSQWSIKEIMEKELYGLSPYVYVRNSPLIRIDPNGYIDWLKVGLGTLGTIGGVVETVAGVAGCIGSSPTVVGSVISAGVVVHGLGTTAFSFAQVLDGFMESDNTKGISGLTEATLYGTDKVGITKGAQDIGKSIDLGVQIYSGGNPINNLKNIGKSLPTSTLEAAKLGNYQLKVSKESIKLGSSVISIGQEFNQLQEIVEQITF